MNLRAYFQKIRDVEAAILDDVVTVVSLGGEDFGLAGILTEVTKAVAAKMIVEHRSRLATAEEVAKHLANQDAIRRRMQEEDASQRLQVAILSDSQVKSFRQARKKG